MTETETLTQAASAWVTAVLPRLNEEQFEIFEAMLEGRLDVAIEVRLRKGTVCLAAIEEIDETQRRIIQLYRQDVAPLRPAGHGPGSDRIQ